MSEALKVIDAKFEVLGAPRMVVDPVEALEQRKRLAVAVSQQLTPKVDFDVAPGTDKQVLLQPGADKLLNLYGLMSRTTCVKAVERWDEGHEFFHYVYRADIIWVRRVEDGSMREEILAQVEGSANSRESKYAWRWAKLAELAGELRAQATAGDLKTQNRAEAVIEFELKKDEERWARCVAEKWKSESFVAKSGKTFVRYFDPHAVMYRIPNDGICDQVNTLQKMAQKRAYVGATIKATKASDLFTQDMEDLAENEAVSKGAPAPVAAPKEAPEKASGKPQETPKAAEAPKTQPAATVPQEGKQEAKQEVAPAETGDAPDEGHIALMMGSAKTEDQVIEAWGLALKHQATLGLPIVKKFRDLRDQRLKEFHP